MNRRGFEIQLIWCRLGYHFGFFFQPNESSCWVTFHRAWSGCTKRSNWRSSALRSARPKCAPDVINWPRSWRLCDNNQSTLVKSHKLISLPSCLIFTASPLLLLLRLSCDSRGFLTEVAIPLSLIYAFMTFWPIGLCPSFAVWKWEILLLYIISVSF